MPRGNGGVIGPANIPTTSSAKGVWSLSELTLAVRQGIWPSPTLLDPYFEYTTLLLPGNGTNGAQNNTFLDGSTNNFTITRNGNTTQGTFSPFSQTGWGGSFNTSTTYLTVTDTANLRFGSSNFTIEAWVYINASGTTQTIASKGASTPTGWVFQISSADKLVFTDTSTSITGTTSIAANTWTYVAVVRAGTGSNQTTLYVNGTSDGTGTSATNFNQTSNMLVGADRSTTNFANGYISNLRLSNTNRTISSTPTTALTADANTIFLSLNLNRFQYTDSTAAYTNISVTGTPSVVAFSPFNPTVSWSAATYGGSGYFDGSGDNLKVSNNAAFQFGTTAFTIEFWAYLATTSGSPQFICCYQNSSTGYNITLNASAVLTCNLSGDGADITGTTTVQANQWNHIALSGTGGTSVKLFLNGIQEGSTFTGATSLSPGTYPFTIGSFSGGGFSDANFLTGYMSDVRVIKGTALYTSNFTPPTAPLTAITNTSLLLNFTNAGIYDATSKNDLETVADAQISNTTAKFGSTSIKFDGTGDYLKGNQATTDLYTFSGDFTIETWVYSTSSAIVGGGYPTIFATSAFNGTGIGLKIQSAGGSGTTGCACVWYNNTQILTGTSNIADSAWHHVAVTRSGSTIRLFVDGTQQTSATNSSTFTCASGYPLTAADSSSAGNLTGYIQDLRITKGYARYTANFTAPTAAFPTL